MNLKNVPNQELIYIMEAIVEEMDEELASLVDLIPDDDEEKAA